MNRWERRPSEVNCLFNPAFCAKTICEFLKGYQGEKGAWPSYSLIFLLFPIVFHKSTRDLLPKTKKVSLHTFIQGNQYIKIGYAERARDLIWVAKEAIVFLLQAKTIAITSNGHFQLTRKKQKNHNSVVGQGEVSEILKKAELVGKIFARAGSPKNIFITLGVRP